MELINKKIIITGGAGVIGRELTERLEKAKAIIRVFDIEPKPREFGSQIQYCQRDLSVLNPLEFIQFNPDIIFHLAAVFERTEEDLDFWQLNYQNEMLVNHLVFDAARYCKNLKKFVFASSYLIYDPRLYLFDQVKDKTIKLTEDDQINPRNLCGAAKLYAEKELEYLGRFKNHYQFTNIFARIYRVYGKGSRDIISRWVRSALRQETIEVYQADNRFDYIYAGDVAEGLRRLAESKTAKGVINLGTGELVTIAEAVATLKKYFPSLKVRNSRQAGLYEASVADINKLQKLTGWRPAINLKQGIGQIINYEKKL